MRKGWMGQLLLATVLGFSSCRSRSDVVLKQVSVKELGVKFSIPENWKFRYFDYTLHNVVPPHLEMSTSFVQNHILFNSQSGKMEIELSENGFWIGVTKMDKLVGGGLVSFGSNEFIATSNTSDNWVLQNPNLGIVIDIRKTDTFYDQEFEEFLSSIAPMP